MKFFLTFLHKVISTFLKFSKIFCDVIQHCDCQDRIIRCMGYSKYSDLYAGLKMNILKWFRPLNAARPDRLCKGFISDPTWPPSQHWLMLLSFLKSGIRKIICWNKKNKVNILPVGRDSGKLNASIKGWVRNNIIKIKAIIRILHENYLLQFFTHSNKKSPKN